MNMNTKLLELLIVIAAGMLVIIGSMSGLAQASGYKCTIKHSLRLGEDGSAQPHGLADWYRNKEFIVDRASGRMLGVISSQVWNHEVFDSGSNEQSYKSVYTSQGKYRHIDVLQIQEFLEGAIKPFLLMQGTDMFTGTCTHLR
jgi:hypothetical protein